MSETRRILNTLNTFLCLIFIPSFVPSSSFNIMILIRKLFSEYLKLWIASFFTTHMGQQLFMSSPQARRTDKNVFKVPLHSPRHTFHLTCDLPTERVFGRSSTLKNKFQFQSVIKHWRQTSALLKMRHEASVCLEEQIPSCQIINVAFYREYKVLHCLRPTFSQFAQEVYRMTSSETVPSFSVSLALSF